MYPEGEYERQAREAREEDFNEDLERRHRDNPAFWHWYEARRAARLAKSERIEEVT